MARDHWFLLHGEPLQGFLWSDILEVVLLEPLEDFCMSPCQRGSHGLDIFSLSAATNDHFLSAKVKSSDATVADIMRQWADRHGEFRRTMQTVKRMQDDHYCCVTMPLEFGQLILRQLWTTMCLGGKLRAHRRRMYVNHFCGMDMCWKDGPWDLHHISFSPWHFRRAASVI